MKISYHIIAVLLTVIFVEVSVAIGVCDDSGATEPGELVYCFYKCLVENNNENSNKEIFYEEDYFVNSIKRYVQNDGVTQLSDTDIIWRFIFSNKKLFVSNYTDMMKLLNRIPLKYQYSYDPISKELSDYPLAVVVSFPLKKHGEGGAVKEIYFPIFRAMNSDSNFKIWVSGIRVNGISINPAISPKGEQYSIEFIEELGFSPMRQ